jgi:hypothetical protein
MIFLVAIKRTKKAKVIEIIMPCVADVTKAFSYIIQGQVSDY